MPPQLRWFHLTSHTYGAWLPGDPRGFRTRHHREHVEGDYKNPPPPGTHDDLLARSRSLLAQEPVRLDPEWRAVVGTAVRDRLIELGAEAIAVAMGATHLHVQARMPNHLARKWLGCAKRHAWFVARDQGWTGHVWATRSKATPIRDRGHQVNVFNYIRRHAAEGRGCGRSATPYPGRQRPPRKHNDALKPTGCNRWALRPPSSSTNTP